MEHLRAMTVAIEIDTNKRTERKTFSLDEYDTTDDVLTAAAAWVDAQLQD